MSVIDCTFIAPTEGLYFLHSLHIWLYSHMLLDLVQPFLRATVSHEFTEVSITSIHACTI